MDKKTFSVTYCKPEDKNLTKWIEQEKKINKQKDKGKNNIKK